MNGRSESGSPLADRQALLRALLEEQGLSAVSPIPRSEPEGPTPASFGQQRLWFVDRMDPGNPAYTICDAFRLRGELDADVLEQSLTEIVRRHEVLRTSIDDIEGTPMQVVHDGVRVVLETADLTELPLAEQELETGRLLQEIARRPFELGEPLKLRAALLRLGRAEQVLVLAVHHIASDGWSMRVLARELAVLYESYAAGRPSPLPELDVQYRDVARWQRDGSADPTIRDQLDYWRRKLAGHAPFELPADLPRSASRSQRGDTCRFAIGARATDGLRDLARAEGATLYMILLAAFQTVLHRYTGADEIMLGTPVAGRRRPEMEPMIGLFVNTLVVRGDLSGDPAFRELLARTKETTLEALEHQDVPFERLVEELRPERSTWRTPLVQTMFVLHNPPLSERQGSNVTFSRLDVDTGASMFDLTLSFAETPAGLEGRVEYAADLFRRATVERLVAHLQRLLDGVVEDPERRLSELPLLGDEELRRLVHGFNSTAAEGDDEGFIHELVAARAAERPHAVALEHNGTAISFGELDLRAVALAERLASAGISNGSIVAVCLPRSFELVAALLGVLRAGGCFLAIDPALAPGRISDLLADARPALVVAPETLRERLPAGVRLLGPGDGDVPAANTPGHQPHDPNRTAYLLYTSGSTGGPKGVLGLHRGTVNRLRWLERAYPYEADEVCCHKTSVAFVDAVAEMFGPLVAGVKAVILDDDVVRDPTRLVGALEAGRVTRITLVPSLLRALLDTQPDLDTRLPELRLVAASGEPLPPDLACRLLSALPGRRLLNLYGCSEASGDSTWHEIAPDTIGERVPIGRPIANTRVYLVDRHLAPVALGLPGELVIGGSGVSGGYHGDPLLTAERFVEDTFEPGSGRLLYWTGDLARYRPDGAIEFLGRLDSQVQIRGARVELTDVEAALATHPAIVEAAVSVRDDARGNAELVAFPVAAATSLPPWSDLRTFLADRLPPQAVPAVFVPVGSLPRTPSGKLDRRALPDASDVQVTATAFEPPRPGTEQQVAAIWRELLEVDRVGAFENFFDMGGSSLLSMQVVAQVKRQLGVEIEPQALVNQTLRQFAADCDRRLAAGARNGVRRRLLGRIGQRAAGGRN